MGISYETFHPLRSPSFPQRQQKPEWELTSSDVQQGTILWLPTPEDTINPSVRHGRKPIPVTNVNTNTSANPGMYNHPILVIFRPISDPYTVYFLPMTSLSNKPLTQRFRGRKSTYHQNTFVPITPAPDHPQSFDPRYRTLQFENGAELEKPTYVNIRELYRMDWRDAEVYWGVDTRVRKEWKLDGRSLQAVLRLAAGNSGWRTVGQVDAQQMMYTLPPNRCDSGMSLAGMGQGEGRRDSLSSRE